MDKITNNEKNENFVEIISNEQSFNTEINQKILFINSKLDDGAHRISAIYLLDNLLDRNNPYWDDVKIRVDFYDKILSEEYWGLKNLAYEINKNKKAHYTMLIIESHPDKIEEYERKLRLHEDVIRFMTIKIKTFDGKQSKMVETIEDGN